MTQNDLIVAVPWIIFGIGLLLLCIRLYRSRRSSRGSHGSRESKESRESRESQDRNRLERSPPPLGLPGNAALGNDGSLQQRKHDVPR